MIAAAVIVVLVVVIVFSLMTSYGLYLQAERLREECQMMRVARPASSQCPLVGHVKINASNVI